MRIAVDNSTMATKTVETVEFNGSIDFNVDENGLVVDGHKTITHQELFDMVKPVVETEEEALPTDPLNNEWAD